MNIENNFPNTGKCLYEYISIVKRFVVKLSTLSCIYIILISLSYWRCYTILLPSPVKSFYKSASIVEL